MIKNTGAVIVPHPGSATNDVAGADIRDIRALVDVPLGWEWLTWAVVALIGGVILWRIYVLWQNRPPEKPKKPALSPEQKAYQQLDGALRLLIEPKVFCSVVSDAVRVYLEDRFHFRAPERTTEEFLLELQKSPRLNGEQKKTLATFLGRCDLVKFAGFQPAETELKELYSIAHRLVDESKPMVEAAVLTRETAEEEEKRAKAVAQNLLLHRRLVKSITQTVVVFVFGLLMFAWSEADFGSSSAEGKWSTLKYMAEAVWSKPVAVAVMILSITYLVEAVSCKAGKVEL
ncbi:MAG TPA: hypothetical protein VGH19_03440 [Verrucomicrobiae bacterium]